ncbi:MAG: hypothetical protein KH074_08410, partial [Faecalibacterium prausnitzii]|nr:hypothetical protein [Faecalibacterium prausnitzii]
QIKTKRSEPCTVQDSDRWSYLIQFLSNFWGSFHILKAEVFFCLLLHRAVISRIVRLFLTVSQKPLHEGPERVDERFIRKLCLMFQFPDTEMMEKFSKKLQIVQEKFLVVRFVRWYHYNGLHR